MAESEREEMTEQEWSDYRRDLDQHLKDVEDRFWENYRIPPKPIQTKSPT